ncbi:MAG: putative photosynthetic complex assembly protein PuhC [Gemmatimonadaceae bacterium]|nr:putative photosynthetic complex assembly protein PuhC [Gemmatimonadaceae bacterium]
MAEIVFEPEPGQRTAGGGIQIPKPLLRAAGGIALVTYALAFVSSQFGWFKDPPPTAAVVESRAYTFVDGIDGSILVFDRTGTTLVSKLESGSFGFLRGTLRALSRQRMLAGIGAEPPFHLVRYADGRIQLEDSTTGKQVVGTSFGPNQTAEFNRLFNPPRAAAADVDRLRASPAPLGARAVPGGRVASPAAQPFNTDPQPRTGKVVAPGGN